jgi:hypothetical protein
VGSPANFIDTGLKQTHRIHRPDLAWCFPNGRYHAPAWVELPFLNLIGGPGQEQLVQDEMGESCLDDLRDVIKASHLH